MIALQRSNSTLTILTVMAAALLGFQFGILSNLSNGDNNKYYASSKDVDIPSALLKEQQHHTDKNGFALALHESHGFFDDIPAREWELLKRRVKDVHPNVKGGDPEAIRNKSIKAHMFFQDHYEPNFACRHERRIGRLGDGGKWVCDPHRLQPKGKEPPPPCLVYSIGSNGDTSFEAAVKAEIGTHCEIHVFDMDDYQQRVDEAGGIFHQWGISDKEFTDGHNRKYKTLKQTIQELGHTGRTIDIFKIDCESCEWSVFPAVFESGVNLQQILIELHADGKNEQMRKRNGEGENPFVNVMPAPQTIDFFEAMTRHGYVIYHKEVNIRWYRFGQCIEYGFLKLHPDFFRDFIA